MPRTKEEYIELLMEGVQDKHPENILSYLQMALEAGYTIEQISISRWSGNQGEPATPLTLREASDEEVCLQVRYPVGGNGLIFTTFAGNTIDVCVENITNVDSFQWLQIKLNA